MAEPGNPDSVADRDDVVVDSGPSGDDLADDLVAGSDVWAVHREVTLDDVEIRAAHPAGAYGDEDFVGSGIGNPGRDPLERVGLEAARLANTPGGHLAHCHRSDMTVSPTPPPR